LTTTCPDAGLFVTAIISGFLSVGVSCWLPQKRGRAAGVDAWAVVTAASGAPRVTAATAARMSSS